MSKLTAFVGGSVGSDPWSPRTWSGACARLLHALEDARLLDHATGVCLPHAENLWLRAKNMHADRTRWRAQYYFDPANRRALTRAAARGSCRGDALLQIGHMFFLPQAFPGRTCISDHDSNLPEKLKSGFDLRGLQSESTSGQALHCRSCDSPDPDRDIRNTVARAGDARSL
jgi:hypothetical protein